MTGSKTKRTCKKFLHNLKLYFYLSIELFLVLSQVRILNLLLLIFTTIDRKTLPNSTYYIKPGYNILIYSSNCFYHDIKWFLFNEVLWKITFSVHLIRATCERGLWPEMYGTSGSHISHSSSNGFFLVPKKKLSSGTTQLLFT